MATTFAQKLEAFQRDHETLGCTESEIDSLCEQLRVTLPVDYRMFLLMMGRRANGFFTGSDFTFDKLIDIQNWASELLGECGMPELSSGAFVFIIHQGYQFYFLSEGAVFYYMEGETVFEKRHDSFDAFWDSIQLSQ